MISMSMQSAWGEREINRFLVRIAMFVRRGMTAAAAEVLADRLARRDADRDDRRVCVECQQLQRDGGCFAARQGWLANTSKRHAPVIDLLARCEGFQWQTA